MKILFVCTGNVFRSASAEYCLKKYVKDNKLDWIVASAGIVAHPEPMHPGTVNTLLELGCDPTKHKQTRLTQDVVDQYELIVAMSTNHKTFIKETFNKDVPLFNEICYDKKTGVPDIEDVILSGTDWGARHNYVVTTVKYIHDAIPYFVKNLSKFV